MSPARTVARFLVSGGVWATAILATAGGVSKLWDPRSAFEIAEAVTRRPGLAAMVAIASAAMEVGVGAAILLGRLRHSRALLAGIGMFTVLSLWLVLAMRVVGGARECGCLAVVSHTTISQALTGDLLVLAELIAAFVASRLLLVRRGAVRPILDKIGSVPS